MRHTTKLLPTVLTSAALAVLTGAPLFAQSAPAIEERMAVESQESGAVIALAVAAGVGAAWLCAPLRVTRPSSFEALRRTSRRLRAEEV